MLAVCRRDVANLYDFSTKPAMSLEHTNPNYHASRGFGVVLLMGILNLPLAS
ncbi:hypothetical protein [Mastigocladopsis repens]|uniref:hypothetical protein n=1 Tax=Mastigocladopsis repens TaxID=221287 RepID=UPI0002D3F689|nr:hypothetical protein [Mastigocladopsis repens]